jgi:O-antigen/teichoic acid export membrane protein
MMKGPVLVTAGLAKQAGAALAWQGFQHAGVKVIFLSRTLILARLLSPDDFGLLAIAMVTISMLLSLTDFGMVPALIQRSHVDESHYNSAWTLGVLRGVIIAGIVFAVAPLMAAVFMEPRSTNLIRVLALRPLLEATASIGVADLNRNLRFRGLALISVATAAIDTMVAIGLARHLGVWALVAGTLSGAVTGVIVSYLLMPRRPRLSLNRQATLSLIRYGRWVFVTGLVAMAGSSMLQAVISRQLGTVELGLYFLAAKLAFLPYEVASQVVGAVAFPLYARLQSNPGQSARAFRTLVLGMAALLFPIYALTIVLAPSLVHNILGPRWMGTGTAIQVLACASMMGLLTDATVPLLKGLGHPHKVALLEATQSLLLVSLAWYLADHYGLTGAAAAWLPAVATSQLISGGFVLSLLRQPFTGLRIPMMAIIAASGVGAAIALGVSAVLPGLGGFVTAVLLTLSATGLVLWSFDRCFNLGLVRELTLVFSEVAAPVGLAAADD